jgi:hypothetical protein
MINKLLRFAKKNKKKQAKFMSKRTAVVAHIISFFSPFSNQF